MTLQELWLSAAAHRLPYALWRRPGAPHPEAVVGINADALAGAPPRLEGGPAGFAFHPFQDSDRAPAFFVPADLYHDGEQLHVAHEPARAWLASGGAGLVMTEPGMPRSSPKPPARQADEAFYQELVAKGVAFIRSGAVSKVVPSRAARRELPAGFDAFAAFGKLCGAYPQAFVSLFYSGYDYGQHWLGASPELLAEVEAGRTFRTVALAGTQPAVAGQPPKEARWSQKELLEQANVTRYIIECFKKVRLREYHETGPRTVQAAHLLHLRTDFAVDLTQVPFPSLGTDMLRLLHPTSAVCGMPKQPALAWLARHEGYDRTYYAGFLGPVNLPSAGTSALYVNLRCLQIMPGQQEAILYAGGGLTPASDPAKEWAETEWKLRVIADVVL